jgi:ubiquinone/menaquinone biosynthesis C-methylase UbiE
MNASAHARPRKGYKGVGLEGPLARWYAKNTAKDMDEVRRLARALADQIPAGGAVLEVAPGPGYLAIELARCGVRRVTGLDISRTFVRMANENAARAGVPVTFLHGDAAAMPFEADSFDFLVCRAAFKNFTRPVRALDEMHRVLRSGGKALIFDLRGDVTRAEIDAYVNGMGLGRIDSFLTKFIFRHTLIKRAYLPDQFRSMAAASRFGSCEIKQSSIGLEVSLVKWPANEQHSTPAPTAISISPGPTGRKPP